MGWLAIANLIALPGYEAEFRAIGYFDIDGANETEYDMAFGAAVIGQISR